MIRRRVIEQVREQQWIAVGIELAIVVLGVFIGLQASNWNQERVSARQGAVFAERLRADLRHEDWVYQLLIDYNRQVLKSADEAVSALEGKATPSDEALLVSAYRATQYKQPLRRRSTYDELISTGTIGLILDEKLRDTAMRLYNLPTMDAMAREGREQHYREAFRMAVPNDVQRALGGQCGDHYIAPGDYGAIATVLDYPCETELSAEAIGEAAQVLRSTPNLVRLLRLRMADIETRMGDLTGNNRTIMDDLRAIANKKQ
jgi:hypothetical protein